MSIGLGDRVGGFEEEDSAQRVWSINDISPGAGSPSKEQKMFTVKNIKSFSN